MQALRLNEVLTRVVAWHNRHPLARRIAASQVHSIGEVVLPFASAKPLPAGPSAAKLPSVAELLAAPENLFVPDPAAAATASAAAPAGASLAEPGVAPASTMPPVLTDVVPEPPPVDLSDATPPPGAPASDAAASPAPSNLALALARRANAMVPVIPAPEPPTPPAPPAGRWARLLARLTGRQPALPPLQAAFSAKYLWPLGLGRIARWARQHGEPRPIAPSDWPRRVVETEIARRTALRQQGLVHDVPLHLLTAAIGVGDRRIRVLVDARGQVIGPRAYSPPRLISAAALALATLAGLAMGPLQPYWQPLLPGGDAAVLAAAAASAALPAAAAASGPAPLAEAAASQSATPAASAVATAADAAASATLAASAAGASTIARGAAPAPPLAVAEAQASASAPPVRAAASAAPTPPAPEAPAGTPERGNIRPQLSADERQAAREQGAKLRGEPPPPPPEPSVVFAVVSRPSRAQDEAARGLALMQAVAAKLPPPTPDHSELMNSQGQWRAAWWPFTSLADAERARIMLAGKGLKAEVVEF